MVDQIKRARRRAFWTATRADTLHAEASRLRGRIAQAREWASPEDRDELAKAEASRDRMIARAREAYAEYKRLWAEAICQD